MGGRNAILRVGCTGTPLAGGSPCQWITRPPGLTIDEKFSIPESANVNRPRGSESATTSGTAATANASTLQRLCFQRGAFAIATARKTRPIGNKIAFAQYPT